MAESKMTEFKMAAIIKINQIELVGVRVQSGVRVFLSESERR